MVKIFKKRLKGFLAILLVVALNSGTVPISSLLNVAAAIEPAFIVEIDSALQGNISVTLTAMDQSETQSEAVIAGKATFIDFVDSDNNYNIGITGIIGYEDYHKTGIILDGDELLFSAADFTALNTIEVSSQITDENGLPYTGGGTVEYSGYDSGSATLGDDGSFALRIYGGKSYSFTLTLENPKYNSPVSLGSVNSPTDFIITDANTQLSLKTFSIETSVIGANGTISPDMTGINYDDSKTVSAEADSGFVIASFTDNGSPIPEATGQRLYTYSLMGIKDNHIIEVAFAPKEWTMTFTFNADGIITDSSEPLNQLSSGGSISANEGDSPGFTATADSHYHVSRVEINPAPETPITGTFDNAQMMYSHTFPEIKKDYAVNVVFSINTYEINISSAAGGTVMPADSPQMVKHGSDLALTVTPQNEYTVDWIKVDGAVVDLETNSNITDNDDYSLTYTFSDINANHAFEVSFAEIVNAADDEELLFAFNDEDVIAQYEENGQRIFVFSNNATVKFEPVSPYNKIRINSEGNKINNNNIAYTSADINSSKIITQVEVKRNGIYKRKQLDTPIVIVIDKIPPTVDSIAKTPDTAWTNQNVTVSGTASDLGDSKLYQVRYSKNAADFETDTYSKAAASVATLAQGNYSFAVNNDTSSNDTYYVWAYDLSGNKSVTYQSIVVNIDIVAPKIADFTFQKIEPPMVSKMINFLTFGTFYNEKIEVIIAAKDDDISSGLETITIYSDGAVVETKPASDSWATFTLTLADFNNNEISASVTDKAGNDSADNGLVKPQDTGITSNAHSNKVILKNEVPTIAITPVNEPLYTNEAGENWYNENVEFKVEVETESVGLNSVIIKVNNVEVINDVDFAASLTSQRGYTVNTGANPLDGGNTIEVIAVNNCCGETTGLKTVFIDKTNPKIVGFNIEKEKNDLLGEVLNFLTFGNFFNEKVKITVIADDRYGAASGISTVTLYANGEPVDGSPQMVNEMDEGTYQAEFILPENIIPETKLFDAVLAAVATDNVGNITGKDNDHQNGVPVTPLIVNSDLESERLVIETINPVIEISAPEAVYIDGNNKKWYADDVLFMVTAKDTDAGIRSIRIKINNMDITNDIEGKAVTTDFYNAETREEVFKINTSQGVRADDGSYLLEVTVTDNAGNIYSVNDLVYKDINKPAVTGYRFVPATSDGVDETSQFVDYLEYEFYFKTDFTAIIQVSDPEPSSGPGRVNYRLVSCQNGARTGETSGTQIIVDGMAVIAVPKGFKGQIFVEAFDNVENVSEEVTPQAFVVDGTNPEISITNNYSTSYNDAVGNGLYISGMSFTVVVSDRVSGIKEIGYSQSAEKNFYDRLAISVDNVGYGVGGNLGDGWIITGMDENLVTEASKTFSFDVDDNDIILTFDVTDRSGNKEENIQSEKVTVDKTNPIIDIVFRDDDDSDLYYNANRVADITVYERNFDATLISAVIENTFGSVPTFSFTEISNTEYAAVIDFDEGDYIFDLTGTDLGGLEAAVNFSGGNEKLFYVDKTKPVIEENFNEFEKSNRSFVDENNSFNTDKTVNIKVTEHNFDPELVNLHIVRKDAGEPHSASGLVDATYEIGAARWESADDTHTISFTLDADAVYQVSIAPSDLTGNSADSRSTVVFEIDKTAPIVTAKNGTRVSEDDTEFLDIYPFSRKNEPRPTVRFDDLNIAHLEYNLTVYIPDHTSPEATTIIRPQTVYHREDADKSGRIGGSEFTLPDFTEDGIYALELTAVDVAGNRSLLNLNTYARMMEQDILSYIMESNPVAQTGLYSFQYQNGDTISKRPDNFSDIKILVMAKKDADIDIVLRDNNADEVNTYIEPIADNSLYGVGIYDFVLKSTFFSDNFQEDTDVELYLTVKSEGNRIDLGKMHIDNVAPTCTLPMEFQSWTWYYGEEDRTVTINNISELIDENQCKVYDNGKDLAFEYSSADNTLSFVLGKGWHNVGIIINDMARNANNIQEKENIHIGLFWLWIIMASAISFNIIIAFTFIHHVKMKRESEN